MDGVLVLVRRLSLEYINTLKCLKKTKILNYRCRFDDKMIF